MSNTTMARLWNHLRRRGATVHANVAIYNARQPMRMLVASYAGRTSCLAFHPNGKFCSGFSYFNDSRGGVQEHATFKAAIDALDLPPVRVEPAETETVLTRDYNVELDEPGLVSPSSPEGRKLLCLYDARHFYELIGFNGVPAWSREVGDMDPVPGLIGLTSKN